MVFSFLKAFGSVKVRDAAKSVVDSLVAFDPKGATSAQLKMMDEQLDELGTKISVTQRDYEKAAAELDAARKLNRTRLTAAESLQAKIEAGDVSASTSLDSLLKIIDEAQPDLDSLKTNEAEVKAYLADLNAAYKAAADKLKGARATLQQAERAMGHAEMAQKRAAERADVAATAAGIHTGGDTLNVALDAMKRKTEDALNAASAATMKADTLAPSDSEKADPAIAEAMRAASGSPAKPQSSAERLEALKNRAA